MAVADEHNVQCNRGSLAFSILESVAWTRQRESLRARYKNLSRPSPANNDEERNCYTIATILCAHAASEAFLKEWPKKHAPSIYEEIVGRQYRAS